MSGHRVELIDLLDTFCYVCWVSSDQWTLNERQTSLMVHPHLSHHLWIREGQQTLSSSLRDKHLFQSSASFVPHLFSYLQSRKPPAGKGILHFSAACFFNLCCSALVCILQGEKEGQGGSPRRALPLERTGSVMRSWTKTRQSSSETPESCWTKSSWRLGSRSSEPLADARVPGCDIWLPPAVIWSVPAPAPVVSAAPSAHPSPRPAAR